MKGYSISALIVFLLSSQILAQGDGTNNSVLQRLFQDKQHVVPPSAEPASLGKYGEYQINMYTGAPSISVPIYTMSGTELSMNVALNYNAQGNKVADLPGWVGTGWSLSAGGVISRSVKAEPDLKRNYFDFAEEIESRVIRNRIVEDDEGNRFADLIAESNYNYQVARGDIETQPDEFHFSINGRSGKFYISPYGMLDDSESDGLLNHSNTSLDNQDRGIYMREYQDLRIEPTFDAITGDIIKFLVIDENGTKYFFETTERTKTIHPEPLSLGTDTEIIRSSRNYIQEFNSSWYLSKVESKNANETCTLEYAIEADFYKLPINVETFKYTSITSTFTDGELNVQPPTVMNGQGGAGPISDVIGKKYLVSITHRFGLTETERLVFDSEKLSELNARIPLAIDRCDFLNESERVLNAVRLFRLGQPTGVTWDLDYDCSIGRLTMKSIQQTGGGDAIEPYQFEYNPLKLPEYFSSQIDHWGYFNNVPGLIPQYDITTGVLDLSVREPDTGAMKAGILEKIVYPTKGATVFEFETHRTTELSEDVDFFTAKNGRFPLYDVSTCNLERTCCVDMPLTQDEFTRITRSSKLVVPTDEQISKGRIKLVARYTCRDADIPDNEPVDNYFRAKIKIFDVTGQEVLSDDFENQDQNEVQRTWFVDVSSLPGTGCYTIELVGVQARVTALWQVEDVNFVPRPILQGGLRVKSIKTFDDPACIEDDLLLHKAYDYNFADGRSSGIVLRDPSYINATVTTFFPREKLLSDGGGNISPPERFMVTENINIGTSSVSELGTLQGSNVGYSRVREIIHNDFDGADDEGYTVSFFRNRGLSEEGLDPVLNGQLLRQEIYDDSDRKLKSSDYEYSFSIDNNHRRGEVFYGYTVRPKSSQDNKDFLVKDEGPQGGIFYFQTQNIRFTLGKEYDVSVTDMERTNYKTHEQVYIHPTQTRDSFYYYTNGILEPTSRIGTITNIEFDSPNHLQKTAEYVLNSNGKIYRSEYKYPQDQSGGVIDQLKERHIVQPIETFKKVGGTVQPEDEEPDDGSMNPIVDGTKTDWNDFGAGIIYPKVVSRYEVTWDEGGNYIPPVLTPQVTINSYQVVIGKPASITQYGWKDPATYVWSQSGKLLKAKFIKFDTDYEYNAQDQLFKMVNIDETEMTYAYDGLLRLETATDMCRQATTTIDYQYKGPHPENAIVTKKSFQSFGEELAPQDIITKAIFDGIGRDIQTIQLNQAPNPSEHIIVSMEYDGVGRPFKQYEPITSTIPTFNQPSGFFTETAYEPSPLNRPISVTPPDWPYPTITEYGVNESGSLIDYHTDASEVDEGLLHLVRSIDPNGNITEMYGDKVGRELLSRRLNDTVAQPNDTYKIYDDKDRVTTIVPPGATINDAELLFQYVYLEDDLVQSKKLPDREIENYAYNSRHLLVYRQEGNMRAVNRIYTTTYDDYGRVLQEGFNPINFSNLDLAAVAAQPGTGTYVDETIDQVLISNAYVPESDQHKDKLLSTSAALLLDPDNSITMSYVYDACGRVLQESGNTIINLEDPESHKMSYVYDDADQVIASYDETPNLDQKITIANFMQYDHIGRLTGEAIKVADKKEIQLSNIEYTPKEQILKIYQGGSDAPLQTCDYDYLENRFLKQMNDPSNRGGDLFAMKLFYNEQNNDLAAPSVRLNGDIIAQQWSSAQDPSTVVVYGYDYLNRITSSKHNDQDRYNTSYDYDPRGNIEIMKRAGAHLNGDNLTYQNLDVNGNGGIDNMMYDYVPGTNKINKITDSGTDDGFKRRRSTSYQYDANGNMRIDPGNALEIIYSHLNLPDQINVPDSNGIVKYFYTADGVLHKKETIRDDNVDQTRQYIAACEYLNDTLYQLNTSQGYILMNPEGLEELSEEGAPELVADYPGATTCLLVTPVQLPEEVEEPFNEETGDIFYSIKDHLGNTRITYTDKNGDGVITEDTEVVQEHHYYPFGLEMTGEWSINSSKDYNYRYNGKELQTELDVGYYNYGARCYDPGIGRFTGVDPLTEEFNRINPYNYAENAPISNIDLHGLQKYFAADGSFIGQVGDSDEMRVIINWKYRGEKATLAVHHASQHAAYSSEGGAMEYLQENSVAAFNQNELVEEFRKWGLEWSEIGDRYSEDWRKNREFAIAAYGINLTDKDGNVISAFILGSRVRGPAGGGITFPNESRSPIRGLHMIGAIHTHPKNTLGLTFSDIPGEYKCSPGRCSDITWSLDSRVKTYLMVSGSSTIAEFDPSKFPEGLGLNEWRWKRAKKLATTIYKSK